MDFGGTRLDGRGVSVDSLYPFGPNFQPRLPLLRKSVIRPRYGRSRLGRGSASEHPHVEAMGIIP